MITFDVVRNADESGVSGTGKVIEGVVFSNGQCVVHWLTPPPNGSVAVWPSFDDFLDIHVRSHPVNGTIIDFGDGIDLLIDEHGEHWGDSTGNYRYHVVAREVSPRSLNGPLGDECPGCGSRNCGWGSCED